MGWWRRKRWRLLHVVVFVVVLLAGMSGRELVGLQTIDGDGEAALFALDRGDFIPDRSDLGQDLVHAGLEVGGGEGVAHRRGGDGDA